MQIVPVGPGFAAEVRGATLADVASDDAVYAQTRATLARKRGRDKRRLLTSLFLIPCNKPRR